MALTKPKLSQNIDTDISVFTDPILVLHQGSTLANVDTGFLFNRANGLVSNVAIYWSESANSFVTAFTTSTGAPDANVAPTQFANIRVGTATANIFQSDDYRYSNGAAFVSTTLANTAEITANKSSGQNVGLSLTTTGVAAGNYGSATSIPTIVVDSKGRITSLTANAVSTTINLSGTSGSGSVAGGGTLSVNGTPNQITTSVSSSTITIAFATNITTPGNLTVSSQINAIGTTSSISSLTGALVVAGGVGIAENLNVGGNIVINSDRSAISSALTTTDYFLLATNATAPGAAILSASDTASHRAVFKGTRSRGTLDSPTVPSANDLVLSLLGAIYDGSTSQGTAAIDFVVDGSVSAGVAPQQISFLTSSTNASSRTARLKISSGGNVVVTSTTTSTSTTTGALVVKGGVGIGGTLYTGVLNINGEYQFPTLDGVSGQVLTTNGTGLLTFANVSGGGGGGAGGFSQSTVTTLPTGDYGTGEESGIGTGTNATDAFEVPLGTLYDCMEPRGSIVTVDLET